MLTYEVHVRDPLYGYIGLTADEVQLLDTAPSRGFGGSSSSPTLIWSTPLHATPVLSIRSVFSILPPSWQSTSGSGRTT